MSIINYLAIKPILISQIQLQNFSPKLISSINSQNPSLPSLHGPRSAPPFSINPDQHPPFLHKIHQIQPILLPWTKPRPPSSNPVTLHSPKTNTIRERTLKNPVPQPAQSISHNHHQHSGDLPSHLLKTDPNLPALSATPVNQTHPLFYSQSATITILLRTVQTKIKIIYSLSTVSPQKPLPR